MNRRELIAADYIYSIKRFYDPAAVKTGRLYLFESAKVLGLTERCPHAQRSS
jgi:hypothetical protein